MLHISHAGKQVRNEDLQRGYIDLPGSITVTLRTNVQKGVNVIVDSWGNGRVLIRECGTGNFADNVFTMNTTGYRTGELINKHYDSRIVLPADVQEGVYPLTISMTPAL